MELPGEGLVPVFVLEEGVEEGVAGIPVDGTYGLPKREFLCGFMSGHGTTAPGEVTPGETRVASVFVVAPAPTGMQAAEARAGVITGDIPGVGI